MAEEKVIEKNQQPIKPVGGNETEISPEDLGNISGGLNPQPLPPDKLPRY